MGIVAQCPNGHRLNVKNHLAGKTGLCPNCGAKFRIPSAVAVPGRLPTAAGEATPDHTLPLARLVLLDQAVIHTLPRALPLGAARAAGTAAAEEAEPLPFDTESLESEPSAATEIQRLHPAIADRPDLMWCIAFPGGDPSEPVGAAALQEWLDTGQATGAEVVWRSDWPTWLPVRDAFPGIQFSDG